MSLKEVTKYNMNLIKESKYGIFAIILWVFAIMLYVVMNVFFWGVENSVTRDKAAEIELNNRIYGRYKENTKALEEDE